MIINKFSVSNGIEVVLINIVKPCRKEESKILIMKVMYIIISWVKTVSASDYLTFKTVQLPIDQGNVQ